MSRSSELHRKIDRYAGIPLAFLLGGLKPRAPLPTPIRSIGFLQPTAIGDTILCSGVIAALAKAYPAAALHFFHGKSNAAAVAMLGMDIAGHPCNYLNPAAAISQIRRHDLDVLIDFTPWPRLTGLIGRLSGARCTIGFKSAGQYRHWNYDQRVDFVPGPHVGESLDAIAHLFGLAGHHHPCVKVTAAAPDLGIDYQRLILLHTCPGGSRAQAKSWPTPHWVHLARALIDDGWQVGLTGTNADRASVGQIIAAIDRPGRCHDLCQRLTLPQLAAALRHVPLMVSVDTGVLHLASAVGARVIGLHGPTTARMWGATNPTSIGLDADHPAGGYIHHGFETHPQQFEIMAALSPQRVVAAARDMLAPKAPAVPNDTLQRMKGIHP